jgi:hypothetical protein
MFMNFFNTVFFHLIKLGVKTYKPTTSDQIPMPSMAAGVDRLTVPLHYLGPDGKVLKKDEDAATRPAILKAIIRLNNRLNPIVDTDTAWASVESGKQGIQSIFGKYLPEKRVDWKGHDPAGDEALRWWVFSGFGALELRRLEEQTARTEQVGGRIPWFVSSYEFLKDLPVRPGLASYGGAVYLDQQGNILKMRLRGKDVFPHEGQTWEAAKFAYRSTSLMWATMYHHLFYSHYSISNSGVLATMQNLSPDHPLRLLLKPFLFRTAAINNGAADSLLPKGSSFNRATGFTWESTEAGYSLMLKMVTFKPLPELLRERGIDPVSLAGLPDDIFPFGRDGELFWNTLNKFTTDMLHHAPVFSNLVKSDPVKAWWEHMNKSLDFSGGDLSVETLSTFLTQFFYTVSGFHSWVGHVTPYVDDPSIAAGKLFPDATRTNQQNSVELGVIASITGLPTPSILGDFSHLMPDDYSKQSLKRLHENLLGMGREIQNRNTTRQIPLQAFLPEELNLSVAI